MQINHHRAGFAARVAAWRAQFEAQFGRPGIYAQARPLANHSDNDLRAMQGRVVKRQEEAVADSKEIIDAADAEGRELTADEKRRITNNTRNVDDLQSEVDEINLELQVRAAVLPGASRSGQRQTPADSTDPIDGSIGGQRHVAAPAFGAARALRFNDLFPNRARGPANGFRTFSEFVAAVASGKPDQRLMNATMTEGVGQDGGYAVPVQFLGPLLDASLEMEMIRPHAVVVPMSSKSAVAGLFDYADGTNTARAGLRMLWGAEAAAMTEQKGKLREVTLNATKGYVFVRVSNEQLEDAVAFDRQLGVAMAKAVAAGLDYAFMFGTGVAQPLGVLNAPVLVTITKESGQSSTNPLLLQNLSKMIGRLHPSSYAASRWLVHPTVIPALYMLSVVIQNVAGSENVGGSHVAAVTQDGAGNLRIFGRPVDITDACAPLGTVGDVLLADWSRYCVGLRADASIARDDSRYFDTDETAFKLRVRIDGKPGDAAATKLRDGTNTVGPFIALETR